ncbi:MAG: hypothetical protein LUG17_04750 [Clostridiales bacterium]|nr:hypothetical protein [Clostridiales bacterium]
MGDFQTGPWKRLQQNALSLCRGAGLTFPVAAFERAYNHISERPFCQAFCFKNRGHFRRFYKKHGTAVLHIDKTQEFGQQTVALTLAAKSGKVGMLR